MIDLLSAQSVLAGSPPPALWPLRWLPISDTEIELLWFAYDPATDTYRTCVTRCDVLVEQFYNAVIPIDGEEPDAQTLLEAGCDFERAEPKYCLGTRRAA